MHKINADKLFSDKNILNTIYFDENNRIMLDFAGIEEIKLKDIYTLLALKKIAVLNHSSLCIKNASPEIEQMLYETGIYKAIENYCSNPVIKKRMGCV